jgi:hypothetical protein
VILVGFSALVFGVLRAHLEVMMSCGFFVGVLILFNSIVGSYGSTVRYKSVGRMKQIGKTTVLGASGEISDFQAINQMLDQLM